MEPMKSFLVVRSQSHTSTERRRSLSDGFSLLNKGTKITRAVSAVRTITHLMHERGGTKKRSSDSQGEGLVPAGVEGRTDGPGLLFGLIFGVGGDFEFDVGV